MYRVLIPATFISLISWQLNAQDCDSIELSFFEMRTCVADEVAELDKQLSYALSELKLVIPKAYSANPDNNEATSSEVLEALDKSQISWSKMATIDCDLSYNLARGGNGTGAPHALNQCFALHYKFRLAQINERVKQIKEVL
jgi:uncharacterized protein YecT (DUF1311 family)